MRILTLATGAAALALMATPTLAQQQDPVTPDNPPVTTPDATPAMPTPMPPSDSMAPVPDANATTTDTNRMYTTSATGVRTQVISNGPVADTPENRAKYGQPLSRAGRRTAPANN